MIKAVNKAICVLPGLHCGITQEFRKPKTRGETDKGHNGTDWGSKVGYSYYEDVLAPQDMTIMEVGYEPESTGIGYYVTGVSYYDDGTHAMWGFIHLKTTPSVKKGDNVKAGDKIGTRGGSPYTDAKKTKEKYTPHLHLYTTPATTKGYSWNNMRSLACNPFDVYTFCKMKGKDYDMAVQDGHNFNNAPIYEEAINIDSNEVIELKKKVAELTDELNAANKKIEEAINVLS